MVEQLNINISLKQVFVYLEQVHTLENMQVNEFWQLRDESA